MANEFEHERLPIRISPRGEWTHGGDPILPRVAALFARSIVPRTDGRYLIVLGEDVEEVDVADTAFLVTGMRLERGEDGDLVRVVLSLSDGAEEDLRPHTLMISQENVLYSRILRHALEVPCRFPSSLYHKLALLMEEQADGGFALPLGGRRWPIEEYEQGIRPA